MALKEKPKIQLEDFASMIDFEEKKTVSGITEMGFSKMLPFPNHKFKLYEGGRLADMTESIKTLGILAPIILWHNENDEYIILSGHNRKSAGELAGLDKAPVIIKENLTMDEATLIVTETNLRQRSFTDLSHSERAYCLAQHYGAMKSQGKRNDLLQEIEMLLNPDDYKENSTSVQVEQKLESREKIAKENSLSSATVGRYIRIASLSESLIKLLDEERIAFLTAYTLSFIDNEDKQNIIADFVVNDNYKLDMKKAELLKEYYMKSTLSEKHIEQILSGEKSKKPKSTAPKPVKVKNTVIKKFFTDNETPKEIEETIEKALEMYFEVMHSQNEDQDECEELLQ
ncbi:MAG: ParB N-terminal domain-containing protein [Eubacteriales bacterium]